MDCLFLSDFDGTITMEDTLDYIADRLFDCSTRQQWEEELINGSLNYKCYLKKFHNICFDVNQLPNDFVDPYFHSFYKKYWKHTYILSKGIHNIICKLLPYVDMSHVMAHEVSIDNKNLWYVDDNIAIIDKREIVSELKKKCDRIIFIGDGITDFDVVDLVDFLFVKRNSHLHSFILNHPTDTEYLLFDTFEDILKKFTQDDR